jgi:DNA helicase II / ATP-dependent DNA helicase PcrA
MAILLRSVKANAEPITEALQGSRVPFVVTGMTNLFGTAEAEAARQLFYFIGDGHGVDEGRLEQAWEATRTRPRAGALDGAIAGVAAAKRAHDPDQKRWGQYSIQRVFLTSSRRRAREERSRTAAARSSSTTSASSAR